MNEKNRYSDLVLQPGAGYPLITDNALTVREFLKTPVKTVTLPIIFFTC